MALLWADGFDHYGSPYTPGRANMLLGSYSDFTGPVNIYPSSTKPRNGLYSLLFASGGTGPRKAFGSALTTVGCGAAFWSTALPVANNVHSFFRFMDATNTAQLTIVGQSTGTIEVFRGATGTTSLGVSAVCWNAGAWNHIEVKVLFSQTVGTVEVRVNEVVVLNLTGKDTCATALTEASQVYLFTGNDAAGGPFYIDDFFIWDSSGSYNNDFIGDKDVLTYYPDANGGTRGWTCSTGTDDFALVDYNSAEPDSDTTYLYTATPQTVTLELEPVNAAVTGIVGAMAFHVTKKTDAAACTVSETLVSQGTAGGVTSTVMTTGYAYYYKILERDPYTPGTDAWTASRLSASQIKLIRDT